VNAVMYPKTGYARPDASLRPMRSIEYEALARATKLLAAAWPKRKENFPALVGALNQNLALWSTLAADVADPKNGLPSGLRAQLFYLYEFSEQHSRGIMEGRSSVGVLIDINTAVMRGLRGNGGGS
jgi:flagellar biosynthesis activator protein FlaF